MVALRGAVRAARGRAAALMISLAAAGGMSPVQGACSDILPTAAPSSSKRPITPLDLVRLRDIGYPDPLMGGSPLAVAPDGRRLAFVINQADPDANAYCPALLVVATEPGTTPRIVDRGGELITFTDVQRGMFVRGGFPALVIPAWSPDGQWIAYLRRDNGSTQAWRVRADGTGAEPITRAPTDVERVAWSSDGRRLVYATRPAKVEIQKAIDREGRSGWLYDERVVTFSGPRPQIREADAPLIAFSVDVGGGTTVLASPEEGAALGLSGETDPTPDVTATAPDGSRAWVELDGLSSSGTSRLRMTDAAGREIACRAPACTDGIVGVWWTADSAELRFVRRQGWNRGETALYRWRPGETEPSPTLITDDALLGCAAAGEQLVCTRENATTPRRVVLIDPVSGRSDLLFDPNPEFANIGLGSVERLKWRNDRGLETWGDLVLPPGHTPGDRLPLIVVQYSSRGFLRGGTGDEYPIFALAARGFAVLSLERPAFVASLDPNLKDWEGFAAANLRDWADRWSLLSAVETGVQMAIDRGIADPERIGITGLSDGATTARFALINSDMFAAASISSCCLEPWTVNTYFGIAFAELVQKLGYPSLIRPDAGFWRPMSIAQNASRIDTPILMQLNDDDGYIVALEAFETLREYGKPVEMYVFPNEFHAKWQPVHRLAIYRRNLDWFDFWLRGVESPDPDKARQYARWRALKERAGAATKTAPTPPR